MSATRRVKGAVEDGPFRVTWMPWSSTTGRLQLAEAATFCFASQADAEAYRARLIRRYGCYAIRVTIAEPAA